MRLGMYLDGICFWLNKVNPFLVSLYHQGNEILDNLFLK